MNWLDQDWQSQVHRQNFGLFKWTEECPRRDRMKYKKSPSDVTRQLARSLIVKGLVLSISRAAATVIYCPTVSVSPGAPPAAVARTGAGSDSDGRARAAGPGAGHAGGGA
eukprot:104481-Hanusia_phi.AAC.1